MPAKFVLRSAIGQPFMDLLRRGDAFGRCVHDFRSAIRAVAARENPGIVLRPRECRGALANRHDHHVARNCLAALGGAHFDASYRGAVADDALQSGVETKPAPIALGELVFVVVARHVGLTATIDDRGRRRAEALGLRDGVDGGIAGADDHDLASDGRFAIWVRLEMRDEGERIDHAWQVFAGNAEPLRASQSDPDKDGVILFEQRLDRIDRLARPQFHTQVENVLHLGEGDVGFELVLRDPVRVETARLRLRLEDRDIVAAAPQVSGAREPRWPRTHDRDAFAGAFPRFEELELLLEDVIGGVPLQQRDLDRLFIAVVQDAGPFAQHFHRAGARAGMAERIRLENDSGRATQVAGRDLLDEGGDVDVRGAADRAWRVVAEEALVRLEQRRV